jgi:hypothetical protein
MRSGDRRGEHVEIPAERERAAGKAKPRKNPGKLLWTFSLLMEAIVRIL